MRILLALGVTAMLMADSVSGPGPREIPLPVIKAPIPLMPGVDSLPVRREMPDVMTMNDGTSVTTAQQWKGRREEIKQVLAYYAVGPMPPAPGNVKGKEVRAETVLNGNVKHRLIHLTFGPQEKLGLDIGVFTPNRTGASPAIVLYGNTPPGGANLPRLPQGPNQGKGEDVLLHVGPWPPAAKAASAAPAISAEMLATQHADVFRRGYALVVFNPNDCAEDTTLRTSDGTWAFRTTRFFRRIPGMTGGFWRDGRGALRVSPITSRPIP